jgi:hypothetical protein
VFIHHFCRDAQIVVGDAQIGRLYIVFIHHFCRDAQFGRLYPIIGEMIAEWFVVVQEPPLRDGHRV